MDGAWTHLSWAAVRVVFGASLALFHGYGKVTGGVAGLTGTVERMGFPAPSFFAWCAALAELAGGLLVAAGLLTRPAAAACAITMLVALYRHLADPVAKMELALLYLTVMVAAMVLGGGRYGLDRFIAVRLPFRSRAGQSARRA